MKKLMRSTSLALLMAVSFTAAMADEVTDQIESGMKAYNDKDYKLALEELKFATAQIQELANKENSALLPDALKGWTADEVKAQSMQMLGGGSMFSRSYNRGDERLKIELAANSPMINMVSMMLSNPMMAAGNPKMKPYRYKRIKGVMEEKRNAVETKLLVAGQILVSMDYNKPDKAKAKEVVEAYLDSMDFDKIKDAFLQ